MSKVKHIILMVLLLTGAFVLLGFAIDRQHHRNCESFEVEFVGNTELDFVRAEEVKQRINDRGDLIIGQVMSEINTEQIELDLMNLPHVKTSNVYKTIDLGVKVVIEQRDPVFRFITNEGVTGYIDTDGFVMPVRSAYTPKLIPVTGHLPLTHEAFSAGRVLDNELLKGVWDMVAYINKDEFWKSQILQLDVDEKGEIIAIPRVGNHKLVFGDTQDYQKKFERLSAFYDKGIEQTNWNIYESIDLRFDDQVVCKKRKI